MDHPAALRAHLLAEQGRFEQAITDLRRALVDDPEHGPYHAFLAQLLAIGEKFDAAEREAQQGIALAPDEAACHFALGQVLLARRRFADAAGVFEAAIALEPRDPDFHAALARVRLAQKKWDAALACADAGLSFDPDHVDSKQLRSVALVRLGRADEANDTLDSALAKDPHDPHTHLARGWALLSQGRADDATGHFREALRLRPDLDGARAGLVEALKARNPVYRVVLRWFLFMERFSAGRQLSILAGAWLLHFLTRRLTEGVPDLQWVRTPATVIYLSLVGLSWGAVPFFNLLLLLHPLGRQALPAHERQGALLVGGVLALALTGASMLVAGVEIGAPIAVFGGFLLLPACAAAMARPGRGRNAFLLLVAGLVLWFGWWLWRTGLGPTAPKALVDEFGTLVLVCALSSWGAVFLGVFGGPRPR